MKTIPAIIFSTACLALPNLTRGQALPFQQSPPPGAPVTATAEPRSTSTSGATSALPDGFAMKDGSVYIIKNGVPTLVTEEQVLRIAPNGMITGFDGQTWLIPAGQMMTTDGRTVPLDPAIFTMADRARAASNVSGDNRSGLAPSGTTGQLPTSGPAGTQSDSSSPAPTTQGNRRTSSMRGGGSASTVLDGTGNAVVIDPRTGTSNAATSGQTNATGTGTATNQQSTKGGAASTTATPNQRTSSGTSIDPNATGASSSATPNQLNSSGTNTGPNARTTSPRPVTPNQINSSGGSTSSGGTSGSTGGGTR